MIRSLQSKKGISEIVSYVLLVVIAVGVAVIVYAFVALYVPKGSPECTKDVSLGVKSIICLTSPDDENQITKLNLKLENNGLHTVDAAYVRLGKEGRRAPTQLEKSTKSVSFVNPLLPGSQITEQYSTFTISSTGILKDDVDDYTIEIEPSVKNEKNQLTLCEQATITQKLSCDVESVDLGDCTEGKVQGCAVCNGGIYISDDNRCSATQSCDAGGVCVCDSSRCPTGQSCNAQGQCASTTPTCTDECTSNQCVGSNVRQCGNFDSDSCLEWGAVTPCPSGSSCLNGACWAPTLNCQQIKAQNPDAISGDYVLQISQTYTLPVYCDMVHQETYLRVQPASYIDGGHTNVNYHPIRNLPKVHIWGVKVVVNSESSIYLDFSKALNVTKVGPYTNRWNEDLILCTDDLSDPRCSIVDGVTFNPDGSVYYNDAKACEFSCSPPTKGQVYLNMLGVADGNGKQLYMNPAQTGVSQGPITQTYCTDPCAVCQAGPVWTLPQDSGFMALSWQGWGFCGTTRVYDSTLGTNFVKLKAAA